MIREDRSAIFGRWETPSVASVLEREALGSGWSGRTCSDVSSTSIRCVARRRYRWSQRLPAELGRGGPRGADIPAQRDPDSLRSRVPRVIELPADFRDLLIELTDADVEFVVLGGHAVAFHGHPRATKDLDVLVRAGGQDLADVAALEALNASKLPKM